MKTIETHARAFFKVIIFSIGSVWALSRTFWKQKVCWHHPAMFRLKLLPQGNFPTNNLNFHWRWKWWDQIWAIFLNLFYFICTYLIIKVQIHLEDWTLETLKRAPCQHLCPVYCMAKIGCKSYILWSTWLMNVGKPQMN